jgi:hypothetical protein
LQYSLSNGDSGEAFFSRQGGMACPEHPTRKPTREARCWRRRN